MVSEFIYDMRYFELTDGWVTYIIEIYHTRSSYKRVRVISRLKLVAQDK